MAATVYTEKMSYLVADEGPVHVIRQKEDAAVVALVDSTTETPAGTIADISTVVTGVDGTGSNAASKADVDTRLGAINQNLSNLTAKLNLALTALRNHGSIAE